MPPKRAPASSKAALRRQKKGPTKAQIREEARIISIFNRLEQTTPELIDRVLEIAITSKKFSWRAAGSGAIGSTIEDFFAWPPGITPQQRQMLTQRAIPIFLKNVIIELPAHFVQGEIPSFSLPQSLQGKENYIRYLVLDLEIDSRDNSFQRELNRTIAGMDDLKAKLPRVEACVISLFFSHRMLYATPTFAESVLMMWNRTGFSKSETLKNSMVKLIDAFHAGGPGSRRYIRFCMQDMDSERSAKSDIGPLVDVTHAVGPGSGEESAEVDSEQADVSVGKLVLKRAYQYHRKGRLHEQWA